MARAWTLAEKQEGTRELIRLYVKNNLTISEVGKRLGISESGVYERLKRLGIPSLRNKKRGYNNMRQDIVLPDYSDELAELVGALLGDGHLTPTQVIMTIGNKDKYVDYIQALMAKVLGVTSKISMSRRGHLSVYVGSTKLTKWFIEMGLAYNKVEAQVEVPRWIFGSTNYMARALRGLWDTDGSVYKLRFGTQMSFRNRSFPLLRDVRLMLVRLGYHPSKVTGYSVYLTRREEVIRFANEIGFGNLKHVERLSTFLISRDG